MNVEILGYTATVVITIAPILRKRRDGHLARILSLTIWLIYAILTEVNPLIASSTVGILAESYGVIRNWKK